MDHHLQQLRRKLDAEPDDPAALAALARAMAQRGEHAAAYELLIDHGALEREDPVLYEVGAPLISEQAARIGAVPEELELGFLRDGEDWRWEPSDLPAWPLPVLAIKLFPFLGLIAEARSAIAAWPSLRALDLTECPINDDQLASLISPGLRSLRVWGPHLTDRALAIIATLPRLEELAIYEIFDLATDGLARLASLTALRSLILEGFPSLTNEGLDQIAKLERLERLTIAGVLELDDRSLAHLSRLTRLESLDLTGAKLLSPGVQVLSSLTRLRRLDLTGAELPLSLEEIRAALPEVELVVGAEG